MAGVGRRSTLAAGATIALLLCVTACRKPASLECSHAGASALYDRRIRPILSSQTPVTCNQCHLSGIDLSIYVRATPCQTMACLQERGLVDFEQPERSKVLSWIDRAKPQSTLITDRVIRAEHDAFLEWIQYSATCGEEVCSPFADACGGSVADAAVSCGASAPVTDAAIDPADCSERGLEQLFSTSVYASRERCYPCHFVGDPRVANTPQWIWDNLSAQLSPAIVCDAGSLATMRTVLAHGYVDLQDPTRSLLLLKPLSTAGGGVPHGGDQKFEGPNDPTYKAFLSWIERYATCAAADPSLPKAGTPPLLVDAGQSPAGASIYDYCNCMLIKCHDAAHGKWGDSDDAMLAGCRAEAITLPTNGAPTATGNFLECRAAACARAEVSPLACRDALGVVNCL